jgi:hypothetical protein
MRVLVKAVRVLLESIRGQVKAMEVLVHYRPGGQALALKMLVEAVRVFVRNVRVLLTIRGHSRPHESDCTGHGTAYRGLESAGKGARVGKISLFCFVLAKFDKLCMGAKWSLFRLCQLEMKKWRRFVNTIVPWPVLVR